MALSDRVLSALAASMPTALRAWADGHWARMNAHVELATATKAVQDVVSTSIAVGRRGASEKKPGSVDAFTLRRFDSGVIKKSVDILNSLGWVARTIAAYGGTSIAIYPSASLLLAWKRNDSRYLAKVGSNLPTPATGTVANSVTPKGSWFLAGNETWFRPGDGKVAYRMPGRPELPPEQADAPPEWALPALRVASWGLFKNFPGPADKSALDTLAPFTADSTNRYGLNGAGWVNLGGQGYLAATDGNRVHLVAVPETPPDALNEVLWSHPLWTTPTWGGQSGGTVFNVSGHRVEVGQQFPDVSRAIPRREYQTWSIDLTLPEMKKLRAFAAQGGKAGVIVVQPDGLIYLAKPKQSHAEAKKDAINLGTVSGDTQKAPRIGANAHFLKQALDAMIAARLPIVWSFGNRGTSPMRLDQGDVQFHVLMPMRLD